METPDEKFKRIFEDICSNRISVTENFEVSTPEKRFNTLMESLGKNEKSDTKMQVRTFNIDWEYPLRDFILKIFGKKKEN